jgi:uncharacterized iron-regulated membrane protein
MRSGPFSIALRRYLFRVHLWTAVSSGLFFVVLAVTGSLLGFQEKIDRALHLRLYEVTPGPQYLKMSQILSSIKKAFPTDDIVAVTMPVSRRDAWQVALPSGIAYIDPYTGRVLGLRQRGTAFVGVISQIHVSLACGRVGRTAVRWIDFAALVLLLSGIQLWWPMRRIGIRPKPLQGGQRLAARRFWVDVHNSAGALSFIMLMVLVATGAVLSCEGSVVWLLNQVSQPNTPSAVVMVQPPEDKPYISVDQALSAGTATLPRSIPTRIQMPAYGGTYRIEMTSVARFGSNLTDVLTLDPYSGRILADDSSRNASLAERVLTTTAALHTGSVLGNPGRAMMALASLLVALQAWSGAIMLWKRRFAHDGRSR